MSRRKARELAMQFLFQQDLRNELGTFEDREFWREKRVDPETKEYALALLKRYHTDRAAIDTLIGEHLQNWNMQRVAVVDRNILRMAVAELLVRVTPGPVIIDEAIEIARKFGGDDSTEFVNGVLDSVSRRLESSPDLEKA